MKKRKELTLNSLRKSKDPLRQAIWESFNGSGLRKILDVYNAKARTVNKARAAHHDKRHANQEEIIRKDIKLQEGWIEAEREWAEEHAATADKHDVNLQINRLALATHLTGEPVVAYEDQEHPPVGTVVLMDDAEGTIYRVVEGACDSIRYPGKCHDWERIATLSPPAEEGEEVDASFEIVPDPPLPSAHSGQRRPAHGGFPEQGLEPPPQKLVPNHEYAVGEIVEMPDGVVCEVEGGSCGFGTENVCYGAKKSCNNIGLMGTCTHKHPRRFTPVRKDAGVVT